MPRTFGLSTFILALVIPVSVRAQKPATAQAPALKLQSFSVIVRDYDEAKEWYTSRLGFVAVRDQKFGASERFLEVAPPGQANFGIVLQIAHSTPSPSEPQMSNDYSDRIGKQVNIVLYSSDVEGFAKTLRARGVKLTSEVQHMPWGTQFTFTDLYGNSFVAVGAPTANEGK